MKVKDGFILKDVAGSKIVIATGERRLDFNGIITFNEVGAVIFNMLDGTNTVEDIVNKISTDYEVDTETVRADVDRMIEKMKANNLIEE